MNTVEYLETYHYDPDVIYFESEGYLNDSQIIFSKIVRDKIKRHKYNIELAYDIWKACELFEYSRHRKEGYFAEVNVLTRSVKITICDSNHNPCVDYYIRNRYVSCYKRQILRRRQKLIDKGIYDEEIHRADDLRFAK